MRKVGPSVFSRGMGLCSVRKIQPRSYGLCATDRTAVVDNLGAGRGAVNKWCRMFETYCNRLLQRPFATQPSVQSHPVHNQCGNLAGAPVTNDDENHKVPKKIL